jgi:taurine dioxygenase
MGALLSAKLLPPSGGDTLWSSGVAAFEALSPAFQRLLTGLTAEHDILKSFHATRFARTPEEQLRFEAARKNNPVVTHPVIRTHPVTGRKGIFVSEGFSTRILELSPAESDAVLALLFKHIAKPEFTVRWRWKTNDFAFWDNRLTQHYATNDYLPHRRIMNRATVLGDKPF